MDPVQPEAFWRAGLRQLAGRADDSAWTLVVEDVTQPAFMQAPVTQADFERNFNTQKLASDDLDLLLTAKNFDVKSHRVTSGKSDEWIFALISLQTMSGYILKHQGIARMNSGFGNRSCMSIQYSLRYGRRWQRDVLHLLDLRPTLLASPWPYRNDGIVLTWLPPWDRDSSLPLYELDPFFVEISRGVRLRSHQQGYIAQTSIEKQPRIFAKHLAGIVGDPWIPLDLRDKPKILTISPAGFTPELLRNVLFEEGFELSKIQKPDAQRSMEACFFHAAVLVRGQGVTDGFHEKRLRIPGRIASRLFDRSMERDRLAELSKQAINDAGLMQNQVLKRAMFALLEGGPEKINAERREFKSWIDKASDQFRIAWSTDFFDWLWRTVEQLEQEQARLDWLKALEVKARTVLNDAIARFPARTGRYYRARIRAEGVFKGRLFNIFPQLKEQADAERHGGAITNES